MDNLNKRIEELENKNRYLEFEVQKLKEAIILIDAKINKKPVNYFEYSTEEEEEYFYLDNISGV